MGSKALVARRALGNLHTQHWLVLTFIGPTGKGIAGLYRSCKGDVGILNGIGQGVAGGLYATVEVVGNGIGVLRPLSIECGMVSDVVCSEIPAVDTGLLLEPATKGVADGRRCGRLGSHTVVVNHLTGHGIAMTFQIELNGARGFFPHGLDLSIFSDNDLVAHIIAYTVNIPPVELLVSGRRKRARRQKIVATIGRFNIVHMARTATSSKRDDDWRNHQSAADIGSLGSRLAILQHKVAGQGDRTAIAIGIDGIGGIGPTQRRRTILTISAFTNSSTARATVIGCDTTAIDMDCLGIGVAVAL